MNDLVRIDEKLMISSQEIAYESAFKAVSAAALGFMCFRLSDISRMSADEAGSARDMISDGLVEHKITTLPPKDEWSKEQVFEQVRITAKGLAKLAVVFSDQPKARKKIGIVGMPHGQAAIATDIYAKDADFVVWDYDSSQNKLAAMNHCDVVFLYVGHCSHTTQYKLDSIKANIVKVRGGVTSMKHAISRFMAE